METPKFPTAELDAATGLLKRLLRIDTSNPPGGEAEAIELIDAECRALELEPHIAGADPRRPNLSARWKAASGARRHRPLVLSCHVDVVPADPARWTHPPFSGHDDGEYIWGRGAIDMKGFAVMGLTALARLRREKLAINRDVIFVAVSDEEAGTQLGSKWLVENRPDLLGDNPEYVINEVGGFTVHQKGHRFYPVQVAEKGVAWLRLILRGGPGHSSLPSKSNPVVRLAKVVEAIDQARFLWHPSPEAKTFIQGFAKPQGALATAISGLLLNPVIGPALLPLAVSDESKRRSLEAVLRNTATPTCLTGSSSINSLPEQVSVDIDGRLAPGQSADDLVAELHRAIRPVIGSDYELEVLQESPAVSFSTETPLFETIQRSLTAADPGAHVVPSIIPGFTDSRNYAELGAQCYGYYPLKLPADLEFAKLFHGIDERIPIAGFHWGIETLTNTLREFLTAE